MIIKVYKGKAWKLIYRCPVCLEIGKPCEYHPHCRSKVMFKLKLIKYTDESYRNTTADNILKLKNRRAKRR